MIVNTMAKNPLITAVGIDLYGNDSGEDEVSLEISIYDNTSFPFRVSTTEEIQAAAAKSAHWQGGFIECDYGLGISGLGRLRNIWADLKQSVGSDPTKIVLSCLLEAALYTRVHTCLHQTLPDLGLPKAMRVIIGENDWGHAPHTVFQVQKVLDLAEKKSIQTSAQADTKPSWSRQVILDRNANIRSLYDTFSKLPPKVFQTKRQRRGVKLSTDLMRSQLALSNIDMPPNFFRMPKEDFDRFMSLMDRMYEPKT